MIKLTKLLKLPKLFKYSKDSDVMMMLKESLMAKLLGLEFLKLEIKNIDLKKVLW